MSEINKSKPEIRFGESIYNRKCTRIWYYVNQISRNDNTLFITAIQHYNFLLLYYDAKAQEDRT